MPDNSVDSIVTDPPYGLSFMGKKWDYDVPRVDVWAECMRVLKPGGHMLAFAGTRTQHRMAVRIEDAGFEIRDMIAWVYGSGFPKSRNLDGEWGGWGTALKPALEPITVARKPLVGTVAANVLEHGTGVLNIDGCRVPTDGEQPKGSGARESWRAMEGRTDIQTHGDNVTPEAGRWPANLIHDGSDEVLACFPVTTSGTGAVKHASSVDGHGNAGTAFGAESRPDGTPMVCYGDTGNAARFFYCAKASKEDRNEGCSALPVKASGMVSNTSGQHITRRDGGAPGPTANHHPTVKPSELMAYLCRLVTPPGGVVLDPFMGSGSTGKAAVLEGFNFIGIDLSAEYLAIARARIEHAQRQGHQPSLDLEAA